MIERNELGAIDWNAAITSVTQALPSVLTAKYGAKTQIANIKAQRAVDVATIRATQAANTAALRAQSIFATPAGFTSPYGSPLYASSGTPSYSSGLSEYMPLILIGGGVLLVIALMSKSGKGK